MLDRVRIAVLAEEGFEDAELLEPLRAMKDAGARVLVVGSGSKRSYTGKKGSTVTVDTTADRVGADDFDAIIVPGGYAPDKMRLHESMVELVRKAHNGGKVIAAVCHGPQLLISADVVRGRRVTSWPSVAVDLKNAGATWVDEPVVRDHNIITARKPADLPQFNKAVIEALGSQTARSGSGMPESARTAAFRGRPLALSGGELRVGQKAPPFKLLAIDSSVVELSQTKGKVRLLSVVHSLDTNVCDLQTQRFEQEAARFKDVVIYAISMDLPFAQARYCGAHDIKNLQTLSDHREASFGVAYGVLIEELRLLSRAVLIIDRDDTVRYVEYVPEVTQHPDYNRAIEALKEVVG